MAKHTPGPWALVDDDGDWNVEVPSKLGAYRIAENIGGQVHKDAAGKFTDYSEVDANAYLIAAAPELLAALIELCDAGDEAWGEGRACVRIARDVIAKATQPERDGRGNVR